MHDWRAVLSRKCLVLFPSDEGGSAPRFFHLCFLQSCSRLFAVFWQSSLLLRVGLRDKFSGANFCFLLSFCGLVFLVGIACVFCLFSCKFAPEAPLKNSLHVRFCFLVRSSCLMVWVDDVFVVSFPSLVSFSFKRERSGLTGHHTPPRTCCLVFFLFFLSPPRLSFRLFWPCVLLVLAFLRGAILGPEPCLDSFGTSLRPSFWTRGGLLDFLCGLLFSLWCLRPHTFLVGLTPGHPRVVSPAPLARLRVRG